MMLTHVLLRYVLKTTLVVVPLAFAVTWIVLGLEAAIGLAVGAALSVGDAAGMIYLVGEVMSPSQPGSRKAVFTLLLVVKLTVVAALLWVAFARYGVSGLGLVLGIGVGLIATVAGASRGSASKAGQQAIARAEAGIAKEMEDSGDQTR